MAGRWGTRARADDAPPGPRRGGGRSAWGAPTEAVRRAQSRGGVGGGRGGGRGGPGAGRPGGEGGGGGGGGGGAAPAAPIAPQPFTAPAVRPATNRRCRSTKVAMTGTRPMKLAAA